MWAEAREDWISIFNEEILSVWKAEGKNIRKAAMLLYALNLEFNRIKHFDYLHSMSETQNSSDSAQNMDSPESLNILANVDHEAMMIDVPNCNSSDNVILSPDIFNDTLNEAFNVSENFRPRSQKNYLKDLQRLDLKHNAAKAKNKKKLQLCTKKSVLKSIENLDDNIIIPNTPNAEKSISKKSFVSQFKDSKKHDIDFDSDVTWLHDLNEPVVEINSSIKEISNDKDPTITEKSVKPSKPSFCPDKPQGAKNENHFNEARGSINDDSGPNYVYHEVVRGKAKQKLEGWSCNDCEQYYMRLNLDPIELKKLQNKCSKHRSKFKPAQCTPDGFWDLTIKTTK